VMCRPIVPGGRMKWALRAGRHVSGAVEGVVDEGTGSGPHHIYPLGKYISAAWCSSTPPTSVAPDVPHGQPG
jgi:hypothetical protein